MRVSVQSLIAAAGALAATAIPALADPSTPSGRPVPRYESLRFDEVNGRIGPSLNHPVEWTYVRAGLPVKVVMETAEWRKILDPEGSETWVNRNMLTSRRTVVTQDAAGAVIAIYRKPDLEARITAMAEPGVVFALDRCETDWCRVDGPETSGWVPAASLWGAESQGALQYAALD